MSFNFGGQPTQPNTGMNLGQPQQNTTFGFGTPQTQTGFQFATSTPSFGFGTQAPAATTAASTGFNFGAPAAPAAGAMSFGAPAPAFSAPAANTAPNSTFGFGTTATGAAPAAPGFAFSQPTATSFGNAFGTPAPATTTTMTSSLFQTGGSFSFGQTPAPIAPQFGAPAAVPTPVAQPFSFAANPTSTTPSLFSGAGFTLGTAVTPATSAPSLFSGGTAFSGFGAPTSTAPVANVAPTQSGFQLSAAPSMPVFTSTTPAAPTFGTTGSTLPFDTSVSNQSGFSFGTPVAPTPAATTNTGAPPPPYAVGLLGATTTAPSKTSAPSTTGFGFSAPFNVTAPPSTAPLPVANTTTTFAVPATTKISLTGLAPAATVTTTPALSFGSLPTATPTALTTVVTSSAAAPIVSIAPTTSATPPTFSLGTPKPVSTSNLTIATSTPVTAGFVSGGLPSLLASTGASTTTATTVTDVAVPGIASTGGQLTFRQLEESINKWNLELSEQERIFLNQATQVNAWDKLIISNGHKIKDLHESVERVKLEQQRLDHELDFIVSQQRELEELLTPLEKTLDETPALSIQQHADLQREHTYHMAEKVDCQLKRMAEDIKQIIEHLNTSQNQDDTDPMQQVSKILNAHMDALQWVDQNTDLLQKKLEEVSKLMEVTKKDQEQSWRISYN